MIERLFRILRLQFGLSEKVERIAKALNEHGETSRLSQERLASQIQSFREDFDRRLDAATIAIGKVEERVQNAQERQLVIASEVSVLENRVLAVEKHNAAIGTRGETLREDLKEFREEFRQTMAQLLTRQLP